MIQDCNGNLGIIAVDAHGAHWIVAPDATFFAFEVNEIWDHITGARKNDTHNHNN